MSLISQANNSLENTVLFPEVVEVIDAHSLYLVNPNSCTEFTKYLKLNCHWTGQDQLNTFLWTCCIFKCVHPLSISITWSNRMFISIIFILNQHPTCKLEITKHSISCGWNEEFHHGGCQATYSIKSIECHC